MFHFKRIAMAYIFNKCLQDLPELEVEFKSHFHTVYKFQTVYQLVRCSNGPLGNFKD